MPEVPVPVPVPPPLCANVTGWQPAWPGAVVEVPDGHGSAAIDPAGA